MECYVGSCMECLACEQGHAKSKVACITSSPRYVALHDSYPQSNMRNPHFSAVNTSDFIVVFRGEPIVTYHTFRDLWTRLLWYVTYHTLINLLGMFSYVNKCEVRGECTSRMRRYARKCQPNNWIERQMKLRSVWSMSKRMKFKNTSPSTCINSNRLFALESSGTLTGGTSALLLCFTHTCILFGVDISVPVPYARVWFAFHICIVAIPSHSKQRLFKYALPRTSFTVVKSFTENSSTNPSSSFAITNSNACGGLYARDYRQSETWNMHTRKTSPFCD